MFRTTTELSPIAEALLFGTARLDNYVRQIKPALANGSVVVCDRYIDSWFAYQSARLRSRGIPDALAFLIGQQTLFEGFHALEPPGITVLLGASIDALGERAAARGGYRDKYENLAFLAEVIEVYEELYERFPFRIVRIETTGRPLADVVGLATRAIGAYLSDHERAATS